MSSVEYGEIEESAMAATKVSDCPYRPGTMEWREWTKIFLFEKASDEEAAQEAFSRIVTTLPDLEYDDPAMAVLNVPEPGRRTDAEILDVVRSLGIVLAPYQERALLQMVKAEAAAIIEPEPFVGADFYTGKFVSTDIDSFNTLFGWQFMNPWPADRKITDIVSP